MIASLGMYDRAETAAANDRLWELIRDRLRGIGIAAPDSLTRGAGAYWDAWTAPDLVFSQTCGFPYRARLHGKVTLIGTPDYGLPGCPPGHYTSVFVARKSDPRKDLAAFDGALLAYNEAMSQSGWAAPQNHAAAVGLRLLPGPCTGGHRLSALAVAEGRADLAAIDAMTWRMLTRWDRWSDDLQEIARTNPPTPVLPYITAQGADAAACFDAVSAAIAALSAEDRETLSLKGLIAIPPEAYLTVPTPATPEQIVQSL